MGLGIDPSNLRKVKEDREEDEHDVKDRCLYATLNIWLHGKCSSHFRNWRTLLKVLKSEDVNESSLAESIMAKKGVYRSNYYLVYVLSHFSWKTWVSRWSRPGKDWPDYSKS